MTNPNERLILVSGATGQQGGAVARHLLREGVRVRALTRDSDQEAARALTDAGAEVVEGSFDDRASLDRALGGAYGAFSVQNFWTAGGPDGEVRQGTAFADAANDAGVEHFVYSSVGGAEKDTDIPHFDSKWQIEEHIRSLGLPATILRPVYFMENWSQFTGDAIREGQLPQPLSPDTSLQQVAVEDIGAFAALAFSNPDDWIGRAVELAGDELTMTETAAVFSRVLGRDVEHVQVPWDAFEEQAGEEMTVMYRWFEDVGYDADIAALREAHPGLQRFEPFLHEHGWGETGADASARPTAYRRSVRDICQQVQKHDTDLLKHDTDLLESVLNLAIEIAREGREGRKIGTLFTVGDPEVVLEQSRPLVMDPLLGHPDGDKHIGRPNMREAIKEFAQLDGGFVIDADGVVRSAARYFDASSQGIDLPQGLGSRHMAGASISRNTKAVAVVVSESSMVRILQDGEVASEIVPELWMLRRYGLEPSESGFDRSSSALDRSGEVAVVERS